jgi:hypothetical protein
VFRARRATSVRPSVVVAYAPDLLAAAGHSAPVTLVVDVPNAAPRRLGVAGLAAEEFDDVLNGTEPGAIGAWLAAGDGTLAVLPASARWRREDEQQAGVAAPALRGAGPGAGRGHAAR